MSHPRPTYQTGNNQLPIQSLRIDKVIGIDADQDKSGFAVFCRVEKRLITVTTLDFSALLDAINNHPPGSALIILEAGWLNKSIWHGEPPGADKWAMRSRLANAAEIGRRVGINVGVGKCIEQYLIAHGHEYRLEQPTAAKWDSETLKRMTGWANRTNQDARDAARLAFKYQ